LDGVVFIAWPRKSCRGGDANESALVLSALNHRAKIALGRVKVCAMILPNNTPERSASHQTCGRLIERIRLVSGH
jgi:hypothetical protein